MTLPLSSWAYRATRSLAGKSMNSSRRREENQFRPLGRTSCPMACRPGFVNCAVRPEAGSLTVGPRRISHPACICPYCASWWKPGKAGSRAWLCLRGNFQLLQENFRVPSAMVIFLAAGGRKVVGGAFDKAALGLEISKRLRREGDQFVQAHFAGFIFDELNQLSADTLVLVRRIDVKTGEFARLLRGINVQRDAGHRVLVDFEDVVIRQ